MVRHRGGGGGHLLHLDLQELEDHRLSHYTDVGPRDAGMVMTVDFELEGQAFTAINGGPEFKFTEAISLLVDCETQEEIDELWAKLSEGGEEGPCGWVKDRYGLSWQVVPVRLMELIQDENRERADAVMRAMLEMQKLDIAALERAAAQPVG